MKIHPLKNFISVSRFQICGFFIKNYTILKINRHSFYTFFMYCSNISRNIFPFSGQEKSGQESAAIYHRYIPDRIFFFLIVYRFKCFIILIFLSAFSVTSGRRSAGKCRLQLQIPRYIQMTSTPYSGFFYHFRYR